MCARPVLAFGCCRTPASPRNWRAISTICPAPVGPIGWPIASNPPEALTAQRPPMSNSPAAIAFAASPGAAESHRLDIEQLFNRERIMEFHQIEVPGFYAGVVIRL